MPLAELRVSPNLVSQHPRCRLAVDWRPPLRAEGGREEVRESDKSWLKLKGEREKEREEGERPLGSKPPDHFTLCKQREEEQGEGAGPPQQGCAEMLQAALEAVAAGKDEQRAQATFCT